MSIRAFIEISIFFKRCCSPVLQNFPLKHYSYPTIYSYLLKESCVAQGGVGVGGGVGGGNSIV